MTRVVAVGTAAAILGGLAIAASLPWAALVERVRVPEPWEGPTVRVVVEPGDTLWQIARRYHPHRDPRQVVDWIRSLNPGVDPGRLQIGQVVVVPVEMVEIAEEVR